MTLANTDTQLLANLGFALKNVYHPRMIRKIFEENTFLKALTTKTARMGMEGNTMIIPLLNTSVESFRGTTEDGSLARPTILDGFTVEVPKKVHTATVQFSHMTDLYTRSARASYIKAKTKLMDEVAFGFRRKMQEVFYGDGTGAIARINGAPDPAAGTFVVDAEMTAGSNYTYGVKNLRPQMRVQFSANKTGTDLERTADLQVLASGVDETTLTISTKGTMLVGDPADGDYVFYEGSKNLVSDGIRGIIDEGTERDGYLTRLRSTNPDWRSQVNRDFAGGNIENGLTRLANSIRSSQAGGMDGPLGTKSGWVGITRPGIIQSWFEQIAPDRRFVFESMRAGEKKPVWPVGYDTIWMYTPVTGPLQVINNVSAPEGYFFLSFFSNDIWYLSQAREMGWYDDGVGLLQRVRGTFLQEASWYWPVELVCTRPDLQGKLEGVTESV